MVIHLQPKETSENVFKIYDDFIFSDKYEIIINFKYIF